MEYFYGSGLIKNFADIAFPFVLGPRQAWLERYLADTSALAPDCVKEALLLAAAPRQPITERSAKAELSQHLRQHLLRHNTEDAIITKVHQPRPKSDER